MLDGGTREPTRRWGSTRRWCRRCCRCNACRRGGGPATCGAQAIPAARSERRRRGRAARQRPADPVDLDGLDEVADPALRAARALTESKAALDGRPADRFLVTLRYAGWRGKRAARAGVPGAAHRAVQAAKCAVTRWYDADGRRVRERDARSTQLARGRAAALLAVLEGPSYRSAHWRRWWRTRCCCRSRNASSTARRRTFLRGGAARCTASASTCCCCGDERCGATPSARPLDAQRGAARAAAGGVGAAPGGGSRGGRGGGAGGRAAPALARTHPSRGRARPSSWRASATAGSWSGRAPAATTAPELPGVPRGDARLRRGAGGGAGRSASAIAGGASRRAAGARRRAAKRFVEELFAVATLRTRYRRLRADDLPQARRRCAGVWAGEGRSRRAPPRAGAPEDV